MTASARAGTLCARLGVIPGSPEREECHASNCMGAVHDGLPPRVSSSGAVFHARTRARGGPEASECPIFRTSGGGPPGAECAPGKTALTREVPDEAPPLDHGAVDGRDRDALV